MVVLMTMQVLGLALLLCAQMVLLHSQSKLPHNCELMTALESGIGIEICEL